MCDVCRLLCKANKKSQEKTDHQRQSKAGSDKFWITIFYISKYQSVILFVHHLKGDKITIFFLMSIARDSFILIQNRKTGTIQFAD